MPPWPATAVPRPSTAGAARRGPESRSRSSWRSGDCSARSIVIKPAKNARVRLVFHRRPLAASAQSARRYHTPAPIRSTTTSKGKALSLPSGQQVVKREGDPWHPAHPGHAGHRDRLSCSSRTGWARGPPVIAPMSPSSRRSKVDQCRGVDGHRIDSSGGKMPPPRYLAVGAASTSQAARTGRDSSTVGELGGTPAGRLDQDERPPDGVFPVATSLARPGTASGAEDPKGRPPRTPLGHQRGSTARALPSRSGATPLAVGSDEGPDRAPARRRGSGSRPPRPRPRRPRRGRRPGAGARRADSGITSAATAEAVRPSTPQRAPAAVRLSSPRVAVSATRKATDRRRSRADRRAERPRPTVVPPDRTHQRVGDRDQSLGEEDPRPRPAAIGGQAQRGEDEVLVGQEAGQQTAPWSGSDHQAPVVGHPRRRHGHPPRIGGRPDEQLPERVQETREMSHGNDKPGLATLDQCRGDWGGRHRVTDPAGGRGVRRHCGRRPKSEKDGGSDDDGKSADHRRANGGSGSPQRVAGDAMAPWISPSKSAAKDDLSDSVACPGSVLTIVRM